MFDRIAPRYDLLNRLLTFRMDVGWRRTAVDALGLDRGARVLDLACGTGDLCRTLARGRPRSRRRRLLGGHARRGAHRRAAGARRRDAACPFADAAFDGVTCGFALRNFVDLARRARRVRTGAAPGGRVALLDVAEPTSAPARAVHGLWFRHVVPFVGGLVSDRRAYRTSRRRPRTSRRSPSCSH